MKWRNPQGTGLIDARLEPDWESDVLYKGALGAVLALDQELPGGAVGLFKELARLLPSTNEEVQRVIEAQLGRPLDTVGRLAPEGRVALREGLLSRARDGQLPAVVALGQFPEEAPAVAEVLRGFAKGDGPEAVIAGVTGLRYLGDRRLLDRTLKEVEQGAGADLRASLERDNRWHMAIGYARSGRQGAWYADSAPTIGYRGTGPGTGRPSSRPSTSPTR
jgi:hypothetical protein